MSSLVVMIGGAYLDGTDSSGVKSSQIKASSGSAPAERMVVI